ncbi:hypothetical protein R3W88_008148 [Solanum pinnatisectum]|uniref:Uncharacterized protein n=1 Tax=Solanum pinnatisectum TaxID=50273 RepID=A0AAV9MAY0_9SOLN|nr:hypothetical protein R3W88_008148 [Solanum pinnatisectum]
MKSYFEAYGLWNIVMKKQSLQTLHNSIIVQMKILLKELSNKTKLLRVFFNHKTKRKKKKNINTEKMCKYKNNNKKNSTKLSKK